MSEYNGIWVIAERNSKNQLTGVTLELINAAKELSEQMNGVESATILFGGNENFDEHIKTIAAAGCKKVYIIQNANLQNYSTELYTDALSQAIEQKKPSIILVGASTTGRDFAPRVAARLNTGLTADCTALKINEMGLLAATRPTFGGNLMATILCKTARPQMATVRSKVLPKPEMNWSNSASTEQINVNLEASRIKTKVLECLQECQGYAQKIEEADIIVSGGRGMKTAEGFRILEELAEALGGAVGASRACVDAGWRGHADQVGQTGKTVCPKVYIACGISGAIQHLAGMSGSDVIIAINKDPEAPIFGVATYGIVGDVFEVVPALTEAIKSEKLSPVCTC